jgi:hypothetical protein
MAHALRSEDLAFLDTAPARQVHVAELDLPADRVFDEIAGHPEGWVTWFRPVVRVCRYEGGPPHGVGAARRIAFRGGITAREIVLVWESNRRFAYRIDEINLPGMGAFLEDWTVEPTNDGRTQVRWVLAADMSKPMELIFQANRAAIQRVFSRAMKRMESVEG